jgi:hypothetical protein
VTFELRVAPGDPDEKGHIPCTITVGNFKGTVTFTSEGRNITVKVDGKEAVMETEGKVVMDTAKGVNAEQAEKLLRAMMLRGGAVKVAVDDRGCKQRIEGDPGVAKWFASASQALFPLLLPEKAVKPGDTWEEQYDMQAIDRFRLKEPIKPTMKYTFKVPAPDAAKGLVEIASVCKLDVKDLEAVPPPEQAESISRFTIKSMSIEASGTAAFDSAAGEFVRGTRKSTVKSQIVVKPVMGEEQVAKVEGSVEVSYEPMPAARKP